MTRDFRPFNIQSLLNINILNFTVKQNLLGKSRFVFIANDP